MYSRDRTNLGRSNMFLLGIRPLHVHVYWHRLWSNVIKTGDLYKEHQCDTSVKAVTTTFTGWHLTKSLKWVTAIHTSVLAKNYREHVNGTCNTCVSGALGGVCVCVFVWICISAYLYFHVITCMLANYREQVSDMRHLCKWRWAVCVPKEKCGQRKIRWQSVTLQLRAVHWAQPLPQAIAIAVTTTKENPKRLW